MNCLTIQLDNSMTKNICSLHFFYENCIKKKIEADRWERGGDRRISRYKTKKVIFLPIFRDNVRSYLFFLAIFYKILLLSIPELR